MTMDEKVDNLTSEFSKVKTLLAGLPKAILDEAEKKFASKLTEKVVYSLLVVIFLAAVGFWFNALMISKDSVNEKDITNIVQTAIEENNKKQFEVYNK